MIRSTANKLGEFKKDSWMDSQIKPVRQSSVISPKGSKMDAKLIDSFGYDSVTRGAYTNHLPSPQVISPKGEKMSSKIIKRAENGKIA